MITRAEIFPHVDATQLDCITDEQAEFFRDNGLLVIRNVLGHAELSRLQDQTLPLVERAMRDDNAPDTHYHRDEVTGQRLPMRVEYVIDKTASGKALLGHPFILRSIEKLQGRNFIPTWDSIVFKMASQGAAIAWHRDADPELTPEDGTPIFNVDFYLDSSDLTNCLWGIPGSHLWSEERAAEKTATLNRDISQGQFHTEDALPIVMNAGDVILHNILTLHGSPPSESHLRRVIYFEFRPIETELAKGPHTPEYIPLQQKLLRACLRARSTVKYAHGETAYEYRPEPPFSSPGWEAGEVLDTYRHPHEEYWRE